MDDRCGFKWDGPLPGANPGDDFTERHTCKAGAARSHVLDNEAHRCHCGAIKATAKRGR